MGLDTEDVVHFSGYRALQATARRSLCVSVMALKPHVGKNASLLDEQCKSGNSVHPQIPMKYYIVQNSWHTELSLSCAQAQDWATLDIFS